MTYMPKYKQSASEEYDGHHAAREAELLAERSRENLSHLLIKGDLTTKESAYTARLDAELQILADKQFCGYFLIVADYVNWAKNNGIAVGPGRGSGPCSLVGFAMGITAVDPIKYQLPFERFVNPDKESLPDFDLDFCDDRCNEVTSYLQSKYGNDRVAQISSGDSTPLTSRLVICDRPVAELAPVYANPASGIPVVKMTVPQVAGAGLVQFNAINQSALTVIQRTIQNIAKSGGAININDIDLNDKGAYRLLSSGQISIINILDNEHYKSALIDIKPDRFESLVAVIALCYPRLRGCIPVYAERSQNPELAQYFQPALKTITAETHGLILYQEQVMKIAQKVAGFSLAQGDFLRRALRDSNHHTLPGHRNHFINGALHFGLTQTDATGLFEHLAISGQRCFNKSHAVAYAMIAYQTAWLKANYLPEFMDANRYKPTF